MTGIDFHPTQTGAGLRNGTLFTSVRSNMTGFGGPSPAAKYQIVASMRTA